LACYSFSWVWVREYHRAKRILAVWSEPHSVKNARLQLVSELGVDTWIQPSGTRVVRIGDALLLARAYKVSANQISCFTALLSRANGRRVRRLAIYIAAVSALAGCTGAQNNQGASSSQSTPASTPTTGPTISITSPASGATISGTITVSVTVTNANTVQFKVDGNNVGNPVTVTTSSFSYSVDTTTLANGTHILTATASNSAGQTAISTVSVNVNNAQKATISFTFPPSGAIIGGLTQLQVGEAGSLVPLLNIQFKVDGNPVGSPSPSSIYSLDTRAFSNGSHSISAVATTVDGKVVSSASIGVEIMNVGQWRMVMCLFSAAEPGGGYVVEANLSQSGISLSADSQNVSVFGLGTVGGCPQYPPSFSTGLGRLGTTAPASISGDTTSFLVTFVTNPQYQGPAYLFVNGTPFGGTAGYVPGGPTTIFSVEGFQMPAFSGTYAGTLSYASGSKNITVTLTQNADYTLSASYTDATGAHVLTGKVIGGTFQLTQGFDGNPLTAIEQCPNVSSCSAGALNIYDASLNYLGTLQSQ